MTKFLNQILGVLRRPPAYVSLISDSWIFISGNTDNLGRLADKVETIPNLYGARGIRYLGDDELCLLLGRLNAARVRFLEDPKQSRCPCSVMKDLRDDGVVQEFCCISWTGMMRTMVSRKIGTQLPAIKIAKAGCSKDTRT